MKKIFYKLMCIAAVCLLNRFDSFPPCFFSRKKKEMANNNHLFYVTSCFLSLTTHG